MVCVLLKSGRHQKDRKARDRASGSVQHARGRPQPKSSVLGGGLATCPCLRLRPRRHGNRRGRTSHCGLARRVAGAAGPPSWETWTEPMRMRKSRDRSPYADPPQADDQRPARRREQAGCVASPSSRTSRPRQSHLADRMLRPPASSSPADMRAQYLDRMDIERKRGITIKSQAVRMPLAHGG